MLACVPDIATNKKLRLLAPLLFSSVQWQSTCYCSCSVPERCLHRQEPQHLLIGDYHTRCLFGSRKLRSNLGGTVETA